MAGEAVGKAFGCFAIDVAGFAALDGHLYLLVRISRERAQAGRRAGQKTRNLPGYRKGVKSLLKGNRV